MGEWQQFSLNDVVFFQEGPGILAKDFRADGVPLIRLSGLGAYEVTLQGCNFVDDYLASTKWKHFRLERGDILVSTSASFGRPAIVRQIAEGAIFYTGIIRFRSKVPLLDDGYLKVFLGSSLFMTQAEALASGSVIRHFGPSHLREMIIPIPPLHQQRDIACVISILDDKIELNRQTNKTLEALAMAFFKDWFVDFGPTRAKAEGRAPYLALEIWDLFPNALDNEDKPVGWGKRSVYEIAEYMNGAAYKDMHFSTDRKGLPVVKIAELKSGISSNTKFTGTHLGDKYLIDTGEILFSWSGNPDTSIDIFIWGGGPAWLNQHIFRVRENGIVSRVFIYFQLKYLIPIFAEIARNKQTTGLGHVTARDMKELLVCRSSIAFEKAFEEVAGPIFIRITSNLLENQTLAQTRDLLLPKLMSGEIRLREAEKLVEAVA